jgi:hypothetical protein
MYRRGKFEKLTGDLPLSREEFNKCIVNVQWNEENAKKFIFEKFGINASYVKVEGTEYQAVAYFNCSLHKELKYLTTIYRQYSHNFDRIMVFMQSDAVPCKCKYLRLSN